jgi:3-deoxy-D-manno-octulosonic-acid transferase
MGELMMLYGASDLAFIGGSLIERGGHNPLEPAAWGIGVISGPHVFNFESIYECLQEHDGVTIVKSAGELLVCLTRLLNNQQALHESGQRALAVVKSNRGALDRVVAGISQRV